MRKLVVLKLDGDLLSQVRVTLEIGYEGARPITEVACTLPAIPQMVKAIDEWYSLYESLSQFTRIKVNKVVYGSLSENRQVCYQKSCELRNCLNKWLLCDSFRPVHFLVLRSP
ncbi:MAG: hypothetical protein SWZ49_22470 [Cyanobacteriota bacterium]|nr:hypothetical protein [Cyanobacteriota bacterium]